MNSIPISKIYIHILHYIVYEFCFIYAVAAAAAAAKSLESCPTLCNPRDSSPLGSATPGILQARTLQRVAISFSSAWKWKVKVKSFIRVRLLATPWTAAYQAPSSMELSSQEYWSGLPLPSSIPIQICIYQCRPVNISLSLSLSLICLASEYTHPFRPVVGSMTEVLTNCYGHPEDWGY